MLVSWLWRSGVVRGSLELQKQFRYQIQKAVEPSETDTVKGWIGSAE